MEPNKENAAVQERSHEESYGGFQYKHDYDEYKKALEKKKQQKRCKNITNILVVSGVALLLGALTVFIADTIMRTKGYNISQFLHGSKPVSVTPHKAELDIGTINSIYGGCVVTVNGSSGAGVILTEDGYILTSSSVTDSGDDLTVTFSDGTSVKAVISGSVGDRGAAVIKVDRSGLKTAEIGDSRKLDAGQSVYCKTSGSDVVRCTVADASDLLTVTLDGGFATPGAPVINAYGQTVGIVTHGDGERVYAMHMDAILSTVNSMINPSRMITAKQTPVYIEQICAYIEAVTEKQAETYKIPVGCYVTHAQAGSVLKKGDIIVSIDGISVKNTNEISEMLAPGCTARVYRNNAYTDIDIKY